MFKFQESKQWAYSLSKRSYWPLEVSHFGFKQPRNIVKVENQTIAMLHSLTADWRRSLSTDFDDVLRAKIVYFSTNVTCWQSGRYRKKEHCVMRTLRLHCQRMYLHNQDRERGPTNPQESSRSFFQSRPSGVITSHIWDSNVHFKLHTNGLVHYILFCICLSPQLDREGFSFVFVFNRYVLLRSFYVTVMLMKKTMVCCSLWK